MGNNKSPMEYLLDFFLSLLKVVTDAVKKIAKAAYDARKQRSEEDKKNEKVDINKSKRVMKKKYPPEIEKKMSKDNMDISVEDFEKLSKDDQKKKVAEWKSLTEDEKNKRRDKFAKEQLPKLTEAVNKYYQSQVKQVKEVSDLLPQDDMNITQGKWNSMSKKDREYYKGVWDSRPEDEKKKLREEFMKEQQPKIDEAVKKHTPGVYQKITNELGQVSVFTHKEQLVPKRVSDEMAMELYDVNGKLSMILPVSGAEWEKMSAAQRRNTMNSWQKLSPEEQRKRLADFEKKARPRISQAWQDYSQSTGDLITGETNVYTYDAQAALDAYDKQQEQKKMSEKERQQNELQDQKLDGKKEVEKEKELEKPKENSKENSQDLTVGNEANIDDPTPVKNEQVTQGFSGRRRDSNQLNQELNQQVNNLQQEKEEQRDLFKAEQQMQQGGAQIKNDMDAKKEIWKDEEEREKFRDQVKEGAEQRRQDAKKEMENQRQNSVSTQKEEGAMNNNRAMIPNQ